MLIWVYNYHQWKNQNSSMFDNPKIAIGDDLMKPFQILKETFNKKWHEICSIADYSIDNFDAILFIEYPTVPFLLNPYFKEALKLNKKMYLLLMESEIIRPSNFNINNHKYFEKIFTWKDDLINDNKYIKICVPQNIPEKIDFNIKNRKFLTLISSHKLHDHQFELYTEREKAIRFCEQNNIEFDLYWFGWDKFTFKSSFINLFWPLFPWFNFIKKIFNKIFFKSFPSWRWPLDNKNKTLSQYKFAICYENAKNINWYITEKIFDCFFAWCIPIYLWAPNINDFIPKDTYIDKNDFKTYDELFNYLKQMDNNVYSEYIMNIEKFLMSDEIKNFSSESFAKIIFENIVNE